MFFAIDDMSDEEIAEAQDELSRVQNLRMRAAHFPDQLATVVQDARREGFVSDARIRDIFEDAMNADID